MPDKKKTVVLGASSNPARYSYLAIQRLRKYGHPVVAIGRKVGEVADVHISKEHEPENPAHEKRFERGILFALDGEKKRHERNPGEKQELEIRKSEN